MTPSQMIELTQHLEAAGFSDSEIESMELQPWMLEASGADLWTWFDAGMPEHQPDPDPLPWSLEAAQKAKQIDFIKSTPALVTADLPLFSGTCARR